MLDLGVCRCDHIVLGISARSHVDAATLRRALERMDAAWPEGEEHMAKLSVNAMIGLWARSAEVVYSVRSSSSELDGAGADFSQAFAYEGGMVWDFVYARRLLSNDPSLGLREQGEAVHLVSKTHCSAQNLGLETQTADHWVRRYVRGGSAQKLDWLVVEEITQLDMALWADLACVGLNADVKFLLLGDFRQLPAVLDSWAGRPISAQLEHSQLIRDRRAPRWSRPRRG